MNELLCRKKDVVGVNPTPQFRSLGSILYTVSTEQYSTEANKVFEIQSPNKFGNHCVHHKLVECDLAKFIPLEYIKDRY